MPKDHSLRQIKAVADAALERLSPEFDRMYASVGRAAVPPERLLKASLLMALYSTRSERPFCEELEYNLPCRWFLDIDLMERSFDATAFTKNGPRAHDAGRSLCGEVVWAADVEGLLSDEHSAWTGPGSRPRPVQEHRRNETHASTTAPEACLLRKGRRKEARLAFLGHALRKNRTAC